MLTVKQDDSGTKKTGIFINRNGHRFNVKILSLTEVTNHYPGGGNPFSVTSITVELEFKGSISPSGNNIWKGLGFPRNGYIGFYTDDNIAARLIVNN